MKKKVRKRYLLQDHVKNVLRRSETKIGFKISISTEAGKETMLKKQDVKHRVQRRSKRP